MNFNWRQLNDRFIIKFEHSVNQSTNFIANFEHIVAYCKVTSVPLVVENLPAVEIEKSAQVF